MCNSIKYPLKFIISIIKSDNNYSILVYPNMDMWNVMICMYTINKKYQYISNQLNSEQDWIIDLMCGRKRKRKLWNGEFKSKFFSLRKNLNKFLGLIWKTAILSSSKHAKHPNSQNHIKAIITTHHCKTISGVIHVFG